MLIQDRNVYDAAQLAVPDNTCVVGRWQSENYFNSVASLIRQEFTLKSAPEHGWNEMKKEIQSHESIGIHIRRGDLVTSSLYSNTIGTLGMEYYRNSVRFMKENVKDPRAYIFSDDPEWCKKNIDFDIPFEIIGPEYAGIRASGHLTLLAACKHQIISNSTFAWWAAWLNEHPDKIVIGPSAWFKDKSLVNTEIFPKSWIAL